MQTTGVDSGYRIGSATPGAPPAPKTLREATQEFESVFIAKIFEGMRRTVPESGLMGDDSGTKTFQEMLDQQLSRQIARGGGLGIGDILYRQLSGGQPEQTQPSSGPDQENGIDESR
jgi:flagellar protein FlgJ